MEGVQSFKVKHLTLLDFHLCKSSVKQNYALICVFHFSPLPLLPSFSQAVSINKAINTQEVAVKEKHARNILILSVYVCFCSDFPVVPEALHVWRVVLAQYQNNELIKDLIIYSWPCCRVNLVMGKTKHRAAQSERSVVLHSLPLFWCHQTHEKAESDNHK